MRPGGEKRGNSRDRALRRRWLLRTFGDGLLAKCYWCPTLLCDATIEADRYPISGKNGGRYTHDNIVPACRKCNAGRKERE